jgi:hypothetical protein
MDYPQGERAMIHHAGPLRIDTLSTMVFKDKTLPVLMTVFYSFFEVYGGDKKNGLLQ